MASCWSKAGENLVKHRAGTIYLRAKVHGKVKRVSLQTSDLRIAKLKRDDILAGLRKSARVETAGAKAARTLGEALESLSEKVLAQPHLKSRSIDYYREIFSILRQTLPVLLHVRMWRASEASAWWKVVAKRYAPQRANNVLGMLKRLGKDLVESGLRIDDPVAGLKRVRVDAHRLRIPSRNFIDSIVVDIRKQGKARSIEASNYVAFLAYSGCRHGQAKAFRWEDVGVDWLTFPAGVEGSKGAATRRLPISPPLREILESMRKLTPERSGLLFAMDRPREALKNACVRLQAPHLRVHDLRHFFASFALESGVDVPTVARWLGHKDGGALVLKTYSHVRDDHSLSSAAKLV